MASSTLRPHRSPSPSPTPAPVNPANPAKLTRQSLGPPTTSGNSSAARGFGLAQAQSPTSGHSGLSQPRHVSTSVTMGLGGLPSGRDSLSPRPPHQGRAVSSAGRPSSEFLPPTHGHNRDSARTPEAEQIDQWFKHLASWEATLEEMAAASTDQNFTEELGAIEQWFRVLSEAERTAALYSLLQHSTPVQIRFFLSVLHHMAQADPMTAMLSPSPAGPASMHSQMDAKLAGMGLKTPASALSPTVNNYLAPEAALDPSVNKPKVRQQNRISAPGTLSSTETSRWSSQLDQVMERGSSPGLDEMSVRSRSPQPDLRPKSTDFTGGAGAHESGYSHSRSSTPRLSTGPGGVGMGMPSDHHPHHHHQASSPAGATSPLMPSGSWASMVNTPLNPMFDNSNKGGEINSALSLANLQMAAGAAAAANRIQLDDARKYRRPSNQSAAPQSRNVSAASYGGDDDGLGGPFSGGGSGFGSGWNGAPGARSGGDYSNLGLSDPNALNSLSMNLANVNLGNLNGLGAPNAVQMLAMAQAQAQVAQAAQAAQAAQLGGYGYPGGGPGHGNLNAPRQGSRQPSGRRSPLPGNRNVSPMPASQGGGGGAGGGAGVAGPDDVDMKVLEDVQTWLRVLRLHKYTPNFERSNWREMINMVDQDLQDKGVAAQGARSKFLKVFYNVRTKYDLPHPPGQEEYAPGAGGKEEPKPGHKEPQQPQQQQQQ